MRSGITIPVIAKCKERAAIAQYRKLNGMPSDTHNVEHAMQIKDFSDFAIFHWELWYDNKV